MNLFLRINDNVDYITSSSSVYRPPFFPPPNDWPVSFDKNGNPLSLYEDDYWDFSAFDYYGFDFRIYKLSVSNHSIFKRVMFFILYCPHIFPGKVNSCQHYFYLLSKVAVFCDAHNVSMDKFNKHPELFYHLVETLQTTIFYKAINLFHKLKVHESELGFSIADEKLLAIMAKNIKPHEVVQNAYIPQRIWEYQISRLENAIDDFNLHRGNIADAYEWLSNAYSYNLKNAPKAFQSPFFYKNKCKSTRTIYKGSFDDFLRERGIFDLISRWIEPNNSESSEKYKISVFTKYLNFVRDVSMIFIMNFSMQRKNEALSLKSDCFLIEKDTHLGDVYMLIGETTKTELDSDARWVVPKIVSKAVDSSSWIAKLRISFLSDSSSIPCEEIENPFLFFPALDPWFINRYNIKKLIKNGNLPSKVKAFDYNNLTSDDIKLFDDEEIRITESDAKIALSLTPNLDKRKWFCVGKLWHFNTHQLRRTLAVNMFASGVISVSSIQYQMKHFKRDMTLYYGRHYTNLRLNSGAESLLLFEYYNSVYQQILNVVDDEMDFIRPHGKNPFSATVVNLIDAGEEKKLMKLIREGNTGIRRTLLGFCAKTGSCEYGGIESMSKCAGGNGGGICADAIFVRKNEEKLRKLRDAHQLELEQLSADSMRAQAIKQEIYAIEVYLNVIKTNT